MTANNTRCQDHNVIEFVGGFLRRFFIAFTLQETAD
jgi:hypothetical protein